jgi:hypothetical protein
VKRDAGWRWLDLARIHRIARDGALAEVVVHKNERIMGRLRQIASLPAVVFVL